MADETTKTDEVTDTIVVNLYNPNDGRNGRGQRINGPYLDELQLRDAEDKRAVVEGREPNYDNMAGCASVTLVTAEQLPLHPVVASKFNEPERQLSVNENLVVGTTVVAIPQEIPVAPEEVKSERTDDLFSDNNIENEIPEAPKGKASRTTTGK
jgi:hypothetical protein